MDQIQAMRIFTRVVEAGTFTRAADSLSLPKATVTKHVQALEERLRVKLLNRTTRRVTVTADGAAYYERTVRLLSDLDDIEASMTNARASPMGRLRVDVGTSVAQLLIIPHLADFQTRFPDIQLDLGVSDRTVDLIGDNVDCVIRGGELSDQSLVARRIGNLEFITRIPMSLQAGLGGDIINFVLCVVAFFLIGYFVAYFMIDKLNLATPGRLGNYTDDNANDAAADTKTEKKADKKADNGQAERIIALLGGRENIVLVDACMTRLRVTVKDPAKVADLAAWKAEGALSLLVKGDGIQAVYGPKADVLKSDINDIL